MEAKGTSVHATWPSTPENLKLEQAIVNLSKVVGDFVRDQKSINDQVRQENAQLSKRIDSLDRKMDWGQNDLS